MNEGANREADSVRKNVVELILHEVEPMFRSVFQPMPSLGGTFIPLTAVFAVCTPVNEPVVGTNKPAEATSSLILLPESTVHIVRTIQFESLN